MRRTHRVFSSAGVLAVAFGCLLAGGCARRSPDAHLARGERLLSAGKKKEAAAAFTKAIEIDPKCVQAYLNRAMCYNETGQPKRAVADFSKAIELNPTDAYPYDQRALLYRTVLNEPSKAAADMAKAEIIRDKRWDELKDLRRQKPKRRR
jgi:tetratricopeptide (TPR) repeat protein